MGQVIEIARDLSFKIQFFISSCLELTIASAETATNNSFGTYAFRLDRIIDGECVTMLEAKRITEDQLHSFHP